MNYWIMGIILFLAVFLQASVTTIPFTLIFLIVLYCTLRSEWVFFAAFFSGFFLDILLVQSIGMTSIFFILVLFFIFLYQRKFEIGSYYFVFLALFLACFIYSWIFPITNNFAAAIVSSCIGLGVYWYFQHFFYRKRNTQLLFGGFGGV